MPSETNRETIQPALPWWRDTLNLLIPCSLLGCVLWLFGIGTLWLQLLISNGIGLTMRTSIRWMQQRWPQQSIWRHAVQAILLVLLLWFGLPSIWLQLRHDLTLQISPTMLLLFVIISGAMTVFYYLLDQKHQLQQALIQAELTQTQQEKQLLQQQLRLLQSQIEPHFLFNTLANIQALIRVEPKQAGQMLAALTTLLRQSLSQSRADAISLADEISFSQAYLQIQQIRFGSRLQLDWQQSADLPLQLPIPPLLLQPLLENAIQHGIEPLRANGVLQVRLTAEPHKLVCRIGNSVPAAIATEPALSQSASKPSEDIASADRPVQRQDHGIGLSNTRARLQQLFGDRALLQLTRPQADWVEVHLEIPL